MEAGQEGVGVGGGWGVRLWKVCTLIRRFYGGINSRPARAGEVFRAFVRARSARKNQDRDANRTFCHCANFYFKIHGELACWVCDFKIKFRLVMAKQ